MPSILLLLFILLLGVFFLVRGWIGRPELSRPTCAGCGYDLRAASASGTSKCPECGADLSGRRAVSFGHHRRISSLIVIGVVLITLPLALVLVPTVVPRRGVQQALRAKSQAELVKLLDQAGAGGFAWRELARRHGIGELSRESVDAAIEKMMVRAETGVPGRASHSLGLAGDFYEQLLAEDRLSDEQLVRIVTAVFDGDPRVSMRPVVRRSARMQFAVFPPSAILPGVEPLCTLRLVRLDGDEIIQVTDPRGDPVELSGRRTGDVGHLVLDVEPGAHELTFELDLGVRREHPDDLPRRKPPGPIEQWPTTLRTWRATAIVPVVVLPADQYPIGLVRDDARAAALRACFEIESVTLGRQGDRDVAMLEWEHVRKVPLAVAFRLVMRAAGREQEIGYFTARTGGASSGRSSGRLHEVPPPEVTTVDVIFRPAPEIVESYQSGFDSIWGDEIVYESVPLRRDQQ